MNLHTLGFKFYALFTLVTIIPATWIAQRISEVLAQLPEPVSQFAKWGVVEAPTAVLLIGILFFLYERYLWRLPGIRHLHGIPDINGRYKGDVESSYDNKKYPIVLEIFQTLSTVKVCLYTERSSSYSVMANIGTNGHRNQFLAYAYKNTPITVSNDRDMMPHDGFACLEIFDSENRLDGNYHNDPRNRPTHGKLSCTLESQKTLGHF